MLILSGCSTYHAAIYKPTIKSMNKSLPHYACTSKGQIEYYRFGNGTPIILIPGYATDVSSWDRYFLAGLAQHHQLIVSNNRNVGCSCTASTSYQTKELANDIYDLIRQLKLKKPSVIGISMGGMIAQHLAVLHPEALSHVILINTAIAGNQAVLPSPDIQGKLAHLPKNKIGFYLSAIELFSSPSWKMQMANSLATERFLPQELADIDYATVMPQQQPAIRHWFSNNAVAKEISKIQLPVLILNGEADIVIPPINSVILAETIPHAQLVRWKEGGHAMIYQYPEEMAEIINKFISSN